MSSARVRNNRIKGRRRSRRRGGIALLGSGALAAALASAWTVASLNNVDIAAAAVTKAQSIADLISRRSPGARTQAILNKTKHKRHYAVLAERSPEEMPPVLLGKPVAQAFLPAPAIEMPPLEFAQAAPAFPAFFTPVPGGPIFFSPGGGGGGPGGGGTGQPGGGGGPPGQPPPTQPPAVPEPGTWAMLILGFGATGIAMRRRRSSAAARG